MVENCCVLYFKLIFSLTKISLSISFHFHFFFSFFHIKFLILMMATQHSLLNDEKKSLWKLTNYFTLHLLKISFNFFTIKFQLKIIWCEERKKLFFFSFCGPQKKKLFFSVSFQEKQLKMVFTACRPALHWETSLRFFHDFSHWTVFFFFIIFPVKISNFFLIAQSLSLNYFLSTPYALLSLFH